jgi:hypothetical protein
VPMDKQKLRTLTRLVDNGADTERKITGLTIQEILSLPGITVAEIHLITDLQDAIRRHKVVSFLSNGIDETKVKDSEPINGGNENDEY